MTGNPREAPLYRALVATGMAEAQALETVQRLDRVMTVPAGPDPDGFNAAIRGKALRGKHTVEMTHEDILTAGKPAGQGKGS